MTSIRRPAQRGMITLLFAALLPFLLLLAGLFFDLTQLFVARMQLQNAVQETAMQVIRDLPKHRGKSKPVLVPFVDAQIGLHGASVPIVSPSLVVGHWDPATETVIEHSNANDAAIVQASCSPRLLLLPLFGVKELTVTSSAVAFQENGEIRVQPLP